MNINFEFILVMVVLVTGAICLVDVSYFARKRVRAASSISDNQRSIQICASQKLSILDKVVEYSHAFFPVLLMVLLLRSFLVEPFRIPTSSLEPTLLPGDFVLVNKFAYGLRLPVLHNKIYAISEPKVGEIFLFRSPPNPKIDFIKRVIGVPGDKISYIDKVLYINGVIQPQTDIGPAEDSDGEGHSWPVEVKSEIINGIKHNIYVRNDIPAQDFTLTVPPGNYFAMGDNRDVSWDSRYWGFVPEANLLGKALFVFLSWDKSNYKIRWQQIGKISTT